MSRLPTISLLLCLASCRIGFDSQPSPEGAIALTSPSRLVNSLDSGSFAGTCMPGPIEVSGEQVESIVCVDGLWQFTTASSSSDGEREYLFSQGGDSAAATWIRDTIAPTLLPNTMLINEGAAETRTIFVQAGLAATDERTSVVEYCIQPESMVQPATDDACWSRIDDPAIGGSVGPSIAVSGLPARLGFTPGEYEVYAWVRDEADNASSLSNGGLGTAALDTASILYRPAVAPTLDLALLANTSTPASPALLSQLAAPVGTTMFVKWRAQDDDALGAAPVSLYWTDDDQNYQLIASGLQNGANGGCVPDEAGTIADDGATGCYLWNAGSPTSSYYRVRVVAEDVDGGIGFASSSPVNTPNLRYIAGNVDPGSGTSASGAMFFNETTASVRDYADPGSLLVGSQGTLYFRDADRGLLVVDPQTGIQQVLIPTTGVSSGDGGPASAATFQLPFKIAFDEQERVLVFDQDRIRRIDTKVTPPTIETIIGGGTSKEESVAALDLEISAAGTVLASTQGRQMPFFSLPNGDIYFQSEGYFEAPATGSKFRVYRASTGLVESIVIAGTDTVLTPGQDLAECPTASLGIRYEPANSQILYAQIMQRHTRSPECLVPPGLDNEAYYQINASTGAILEPHPTEPTAILRLTVPIQGRDGELYMLSRHASRLMRFDPATQEFVTILGTGQLGICDDGTPALDCPVDPSDAFVTARGEVYFMDRGRVRAIDENGLIVTLMGQSKYYGDGLPPLMARFARIANLDVWNDGARNRYVVLDSGEFRFREVTDGLRVDVLAGNGSNRAPTGALPAASDSVITDGAGVLWSLFGLDQASGDLYYNRGGTFVSRLERASGNWIDFLGGGATPILSADNSLGNEIQMAGYYPLVLGMDANDVAVATELYDAPSRLLVNGLVTTHRMSDGRQSTLVGTAGVAPADFCPDGTNPNTCSVPASRYMMRARQTGTGRWVLGRRGQATLHVVNPGSVALLATVPRALSAFDLDDSGSLQIYYCATNGLLYHYDVLGSAETPLPLPSTDMRCTGQGVKLMPASNTLVFGFSQNGLAGLAEFVLP